MGQHNRPYWPAFMSIRGRRALFESCPWCDLEVQIEVLTDWRLDDLVRFIPPTAIPYLLTMLIAASYVRLGSS